MMQDTFMCAAWLEQIQTRPVHATTKQAVQFAIVYCKNRYPPQTHTHNKS